MANTFYISYGFSPKKQPGVSTTENTFYLSMGLQPKKAEEFISPYLTVDEQATYTIVYCDGYSLVFYNASNFSHLAVSDISLYTSELWWVLTRYNISGTIYKFELDTGRVITLIENTETRVIIKVSGTLRSVAGTSGNEPTGVDGIEYTYTIYSDRFFIDVKLIINSNECSLDDSLFNFSYRFEPESQLTEKFGIYQSSTEGSSERLGTGVYNSAYYIGCVTNECNITATNIYDTDSASRQQRIAAAGYIQLGWNDTTLSEGIHINSSVIVLDSAERTGSDRLYSSVERLAQGDQYKNLSDLTHNLGTPLLQEIGTDGFGADGAYHVEPSTISFDNSTDAYDASGYTLTFSHTVGTGDDSFLVVVIGGFTFSEGNITGVTYNGKAMTLWWDKSAASTYSSVGWYLVNPDTGANNVIATSTASVAMYGVAASFFGVNQSTPVGTAVESSAYSAAPLVTVTAVVGDLVIDGVFASGDDLVSDQVLIDSRTAGTRMLAVSTEIAKSTSVGMLWAMTSSWHAIGGGAIKPVSYTPSINLKLGQLEYKPNFAIHNFQYTSGNGTVDYLVGHYKMGEKSGEEVAIDETGNANCTYYNTPTFNGNSVSFDAANSEWLELDNIISSIDDEHLFTIFIKFTIDFDLSPATDQYLFGLYNGDEYFHVYYTTLNVFRCKLSDVANSAATQMLTETYTTIPTHQMLLTVLFDSVNNIVRVKIDNNDFVIRTSTDLWDENDPLSDIYVCRHAFATYGSYEIHDIKVLDGLIRPYGAYFLGNSGTTQLADGMYHKDVTCYVAGSESDDDTLDIGGTLVIDGTETHGTDVGGVTDGAIYCGDLYSSQIVLDSSVIDPEKGSISYWYKYDGTSTIEGSAGFFGDQGSSNNFELIRQSADTGYRFYYNGTSIAIWTEASVWDGAWHHISFHWYHDGTDINAWIVIDGVKSSVESDTVTLAVFNTTFDIGCDYYASRLAGLVCSVYITNDPNTPQIPTANGIPLDFPIIKNG